MRLDRVFAAILAMVCGIDNACGRSAIGPTGILVATAGSSPFSDSVWMLSDDGTAANRVLVPTPTESYPYASGNSIAGPFVVGVHQLIGGRVSDRLTTFPATFQDPRPPMGCDEQFTVQTDGTFDPSSERITFAGTKQGQVRSAIWVCDMQARKVQQVTFPSDGLWDAQPKWVPNANGIMYLRMQQLGSSLSSNLWYSTLNNPSSGSLVVKSPVASFCVSRDGGTLALLTADGIDLFQWPNAVLQRHLASWSSFSNLTYNGGGMAFASDPPRIILPLSEGQITHIVSVNAATGETVDLRHMDGRVTSIAWLNKK